MPLTWTDASGLSVTKTFVFHRASYAIEQRQAIANKTASAWNGNAYRQLQRVPPVVDTHGIKAYSNTERYSFIGAAYYNASDKFQKIKFDDFAKSPLDKTFAGGWAAMLQHYFFAAWIPDAAESDRYSTAVVPSAGPTSLLTTSYTVRGPMRPPFAPTKSALVPVPRATRAGRTRTRYASSACCAGRP